MPQLACELSLSKMEESHERKNPQHRRNSLHFTTSRWRKNGEAVCREHNICEQTFYRWKKKYGGMELTDAKRFKDVLVHQLWGRK
ncbi:MAG TPA: hypothetical protein EYG11_15730 [Candidatus Latescibacteria bacterium]|nr:hypothetical protein [Candidatus Latescibacterota bacterium]